MAGTIWHIIKTIFSGIGNIFGEMANAFKEFSEDVSWNLSVIFSGLACIVTIIGIIITYIKFLMDGGYSIQIASIRGEDIENFREILEKQNLRNDFFDKFILISLLLLLIGFVLLLISYILKTTLVIRVLAFTDFTVMIISSIIALRNIDQYADVSVGIKIACGVSFVIFLILICTSDHRFLAWHSLKSLFFVVAGWPLRYLAENFILAARMAFFGVLTCAVIYFIAGGLGDGTSSSSGRDFSENVSRKSARTTAKKKEQTKAPVCYDYDSDVKVYVKENAWGKQVYVDTPFATRHICSYADYKAGKFIVKIKGNRVNL